MSPFTLPHEAILFRFPVGVDKIPRVWSRVINGNESEVEVQKKLVSFYNEVYNDTIRTFASDLLSRTSVLGFVPAYEALALTPIQSHADSRRLLLKSPKEVNVINKFSHDLFVCFLLAFGGLIDISSSGTAEFASQPEVPIDVSVCGLELLRMPNGGKLLYVPEKGIVVNVDHGTIRSHSESLEKTLTWWLASLRD